MIQSLASKRFEGQEPDTPILRSHVWVFQQANDIETLVQSVFDVVDRRDCASLRMSLERYEPAEGVVKGATTQMLASIVVAAAEIAQMAGHPAHTAPDVVT